MEDMSFIQNLSEVENMKLVYEITRNVYRTSSRFSMVTIGKWNVLDASNPSKERDTWKDKCEAMEHMCFIFQMELVELREKVRLAESFQDDVKTYSYPSNLILGVTEVGFTLAIEENRHQDASDVVTEITSSMEEDPKTLQWEVEVHVKALKSLEYEVVGLKVMLHDSFKQTIQVVYKVHDQILEQVRRFFHTALIPLDGINPFQASPEGDHGIAAPAASAWPFLFFLLLLFFL